MGNSALLTILQIAAGGSLVQLLIRFFAVVYKRFSHPEERKATVTADARSVETAADVLLMVRGELREVRAQYAIDRQAWDTERIRTTEALDNAAREVQRAHADLARCKSDFAVAQGQLADMGGRLPGRHRDPGDYDWRRGP